MALISNSLIIKIEAEICENLRDPNSQGSILYFIKHVENSACTGNAVKIGTSSTSNFHKRVMNLKTGSGCPFEILLTIPIKTDTWNSCINLEKYLQNLLKSFVIYQEFFNFGEIEKLIYSLKKYSYEVKVKPKRWST